MALFDRLKRFGRFARSCRWASAAGALLLAPLALGTDVIVDEELPRFEAQGSVSGSLKSVGSDTMLNLMTLWAQAFERAYPAVRAQIEGKGSSTAPPALISNQAQFGPMSRAMGDEELDAFFEQYGFEPTELRVAVDCVAVFVHKDNPVQSLSMDDLRRAFSVADGDLTWGDLGVTEPGWSDRPVSLYGRNSASGTYKYFKDTALDGEDFKPTVRENPGSAGVIGAIGADPYGIGYSGIGYSTSDVRTLPISFSPGEAASEPTPENAYAGEYPMARFLYVYINKDPRTELDVLREKFVRLIYSREGQEAVIKDGAYPVPASVAREDLEMLGLEPGF